MEKSALEQLDEHYGSVGFRLVETADDDGPGMSGKEARSFLRGLRPLVRVKETLKQAAQKAKTQG